MKRPCASISLHILNDFLSLPDARVSRLSDGHLNDTRRIESAAGNYICQCIHNKGLLANLSVLEENYRLCREACDIEESSVSAGGGHAGCLLLPEWLKTKSGDYFHIDNEGNAWRMYREIPGRTGHRDDDPLMLGSGLGQLHRIFARIKVPVSCAIPGYRDIQAYLRNYTAISAAYAGDARNTEAESRIEDLSPVYEAFSLPAVQVIHGDTKPENFIVKDEIVIGCIDLDTLMYGSRLMDIADCLRALQADEAATGRFLQGYEAAFGQQLSKEEHSLLPSAIGALYFKLGLRYYTDYLCDGVYFTGMTQEERLARALRNLDILKNRLDFAPQFSYT